MLAIAGFLRFRPEDRDEVVEGLRNITKLSRQDAGCVEYWFAESLEQPGTFQFFECWESVETFDAHRNSPHEHEFTERYLSKMIGASAAQHEIADRQVLVTDAGS